MLGMRSVCRHVYDMYILLSNKVIYYLTTHRDYRLMKPVCKLLTNLIEKKIESSCYVRQEFRLKKIDTDKHLFVDS